MDNNLTMEKLVNLCKQYGFIYQGSEIYGGLANTWDFGPLGSELKSNVKKAWLKKFIQEDINNVGLDSAILMNPKTWEASGHLSTFSDPLIDCKVCKTRHRADKLVEDSGVADAGKMSNEELINYINEHNIVFFALLVMFPQCIFLIFISLNMLFCAYKKDSLKQRLKLEATKKT